VATGVLALGFTILSVRRWGATVDGLSTIPLLIVLAAVVVLDLVSRLIPNVLTVPALAYALVLGAVLDRPGALGALVGTIVAGGVVLFVAAISRGGVGGGDVKLAAMLGAALGWKPAVIVLAASQVLGFGVLLVVRLIQRERVRAPFPIGAVIAILGAIFLIGRP
jgi:leader peptidase (prepilin peptidase) / N-methyltransferase